MNEWLTDWAAQLALVAGILVSLGVIWAKGVRPLIRHYQNLHRVLMAAAEVIQAQLTPNGGSSLTDITLSTREDVVALVNLTGEHGDRLDEHGKQLAAIELRLGVGPAERAIAGRAEP